MSVNEQKKAAQTGHMKETGIAGITTLEVLLQDREFFISSAVFNK